MNFTNITSWTIPEGSVTQVTDSNGDIIWKLNTDPHTPWYITATYYPITTTAYTDILYTRNGVTLMEYNGTEYNPSTGMKFNSKNQNQTVKIYLNSPSANVYYLFRGVDRLKAIEIGKNITNVYKSGLNSNYDVWYRTAKVESGNSVYETRGNGIVHIGTNTLVVGGANTTIDSTVTTIGKYAWACVAKGTDGAKSPSDDSMPKSWIIWDIPGDTCTSLEQHAFYGTGHISHLNLYGGILRENPDIPTNAFTLFGNNDSTIHIPTGTTLANTVWLNELVTTRGTGEKWTVCADL